MSVAVQKKRWTEMYGWRAKVGHVSPSRGDTLVYEFYRVAPRGVMLLNTTGSIRKLDREDMEKQLERIEDSVLDLVNTGADVIFVGGGPVIASRGYERGKEIIHRLQERAAVPVLASLEAVEMAARHLKLETIAVASPYEEEHTRQVSRFLEEAGVKIACAKGLGIRKNTEIGDLPVYASYRIGREAFRKAGGRADGLYLPCSRWATLEIIDLLENDIGRPVVTNSTAMIWAALHLLGIHCSISGFGKLLESLKEVKDIPA